MASGATSGGCTLFGATGLRLGETDTAELAGCTLNSGQNNFLAPLSMKAGESYVLFVNNFTSGNGAVTISFCGTALLGCESTVCQLKTATKDEEGENFISDFSPNPTQGDVFFESEYPLSNVMIFNALGQVLKTELVENIGQNRYKIGTNGLPIGQYLICFQNLEGKRVFKKLMKFL